MRKLLVAFALVPAISQAALLFDGAQPQTSAPSQVAQVNATPAVGVSPSTTPDVPGPAPATPVIRIAPLSQIWRTSPEDGNMRLKVAEWAKREGWDFSYDVDKDVLINAHDSYSGPFKEAVRRLLRSTEMSNYRIKPCFYTNNLVRVVKSTTKCDPSL